MELIFVEQTGPDHFIKSKIIANVLVCRSMLLFLTEAAFERGNYFEVTIQQ